MSGINKQQNISRMFVKQRKPLPLELLVNIFREAANLYFNELRKCRATSFNLKEMGGIKDNPTEIQIIKYWYNYAKNLLTSSTIVFSFVGKYFKKVDQMDTLLVWNIDVLFNNLTRNNPLLENYVNDLLPKLLNYFKIEDGDQISNILGAKDDLEERKAQAALPIPLPPIYTIFDQNTPLPKRANELAEETMSTEELKKLRGKCFNFEIHFDRYKGDASKLNDLLELCDVDPGEFFEALEQAEKDSDSNKFYKDCLNTLQNTCINVAVSITGSYGDVIG
uniref:Uncharacterized protein n=1 Tax=Meloidogyne enterolobii TaxID=390850 RepID=A0A6V7U5G8_MELEN|nr:unnamed protein product [Meloidogyne enterolobii]